jgi:CDP-6-deoxy-D-xylo-4-hexulose-3-dehydrase
MKVPLAPSGLRSQDIEAVIQTLHSGQLTMGKTVSQFESEMADYLGVKHFVMMNSGSSANLAIFEALLRPSRGSASLKRGDSVLVPAIAWPTTIWPLIQLGLEPVFVDVDPSTLAMNLELAREACVKAKGIIRGIFPIHPLGLGIDHSKLSDLVEEYELLLVNDVCESLGSWQGEVHSGTIGLASSFSFYFSHHITTMEGGGVATNNKDIYEDLKSIRSHGWSRDRNDYELWNAQGPSAMNKFTFVTTGFNIRPMEVQAAIGLKQLRDIESFIQKRRQNVDAIEKALEGSNLKVLGKKSQISIIEDKSHSWMHASIQATTDNVSIRNRYVTFLETHGIETRPPLTGNFLRQPAMERLLPQQKNPADFPASDFATQSTFLVGCHHDLTASQLDYLVEKIRQMASMHW